MENITHTLLGAALAKTRLGRASPFAPAALVIGANLPDIENVVLAFCDKPTNMIHHRGITHAALGVIVLIPLFTLLVRGIERCFARARPPGSFWGLLVGVGLAVASHPVLDWLNTYGLRPWLPFDSTRYHGDLVFIVDPWLWLLLGGGVCLAGQRTTAGSIVLGALALLMSGFIFLFTASAPAALLVGWPIAVVALALARWQGIGRRWVAHRFSGGEHESRKSLGRTARALAAWQRLGLHHPDAVIAAAMALSVAYVGFLGWSGRTAWRMSRPVIEAQLPRDETIIAHTISPQFADPLRWQIIAETDNAVYRHTFSITESPGGAVRLAKRLDDPLVKRVADSREGRAWRVFARHPVAAVAKNGHGRRVYLLDARYGVFPPRGFSSFTLDMPWRPDGPGAAGS